MNTNAGRSVFANISSRVSSSKFVGHAGQSELFWVKQFQSQTGAQRISPGWSWQDAFSDC